MSDSTKKRAVKVAALGVAALSLALSAPANAQEKEKWALRKDDV